MPPPVNPRATEASDPSVRADSADQTGTRSMTDTAYDWLKERLILLDFAPGEALNEAEISRQLGVGRTPVREAFKRLEGDHLVVTYPRRGTFATSVDITSLSEISELRMTLEPLAARVAAERRTEADRAEMLAQRSDLVGLDAGLGLRELMQLDLRVHHSIYHATHNAHLEAALVRYGNLATRIWSIAASRLGGLDGHVSEHIAMLDAVIAGEAERAVEVMTQHITHFEERIRTVL